VSIRKRYPKHAQKVMNADLGRATCSPHDQLIVVVDDDC
jgi:UbiD family decarboxylase